MVSFRVFLTSIALLAIVGLTSGCDGGKEAKYPVHEATGTVTYQDKPLANARVMFYPSNSSLQAAHGVTDEDGRFSLTTFNPNDGAGVGSYKVSIKKMEQGDDGDGDVDEEEIDPEEGRKMQANSLIPEIYGRLDKTPLKAEVTDGENDFKFSVDE